MSKVAVITGVSGQDGVYLASYLLSKGYIVAGIKRRTSLPNDGRLQYIKHANFFVENGDITDAGSIRRIIAKYMPDELYHLAAMSHVHFSFESHKSTEEINCGGTINVLEALKEIKKDCKFYFAGCYDDQTNIVTRSGIKKYNEVQVGELIYTINVKTHQMELKPIKKIIAYDYEGDMVSIEGKRINLLVTPNHKMLFQNTDNNEIFYHNADSIADCFKYDRISNITFPLPKWSGLNCEYIDFHTWVKSDNIPYNATKNLIWKMKTKDFLYLLGLYIGDGYTGKYKYRSSITAKEFIKRRDKGGKFIKSDKLYYEKSYSNNCIHFAIPKSDPSRKKLIEVLDRYNINYNNDNDTFLWFSSAVLQKMFKQSGDNVYKKHIPTWVLDFDSSLLKYLYNGLIDSDGHWNQSSKRESYSTVSIELIHGFIELCVKLGYELNIISKKANRSFFKKENRFFNSSNSFNFDVSHCYRKKIYKHHLSKKYYKGKVWCLEMEDNHNFLVERCGKNYFCGNSSEMFGDQLYSGNTMLNEDSPMQARSPYGASKIFGFNLTRHYREAYDMFACNGILFNHEAPLRGENFVTRKITKSIADIIHGKSEFITLGNIKAKRDWSFAGDMVKGMHLILNYREPTDFVLASGKSYSVEEFLVKAINVWNQGDLSIERLMEKWVKIDSKFYRPTDINVLLGDSSKARVLLGWKPEYNFDQLVEMMVNFDLYGSRKYINDALYLKENSNG